MKKRGIIQGCGVNHRVQPEVAFQEARGAKHRVKMQTAMPGKNGMRDALISAASLRVCGPRSSEQGQGELEVAWARRCPLGDVSRGPAFQRVFLLLLLSGFLST